MLGATDYFAERAPGDAAPVLSRGEPRIRVRQAARRRREQQSVTRDMTIDSVRLRASQRLAADLIYGMARPRSRRHAEEAARDGRPPPVNYQPGHKLADEHSNRHRPPKGALASLGVYQPVAGLICMQPKADTT